jgi:hypothetical protein
VTALGAALLSLLAAAPGPPAGPGDCPVPEAPEPAVPAATIDRFDIVRHEVFDDEKGLSWPFRLVNRAHALTRESVIRRELLARPGDCPDHEALAQTERNLRGLGFLRDARVETRPAASGRPDGVDVRVSTFDTWTTVPRLQFARVGNRGVWTVGLSERNLLGRGQQVELARRSDLDRDETYVSLRDPRVGGSRVGALFAFGDGSDGHHVETELGRPFFALSTAWSFRARYEAFDQLDPVYAAGERVADLPHTARWLELEAGHAVARTPSASLRLQAAYRQQRDEVARDLRRFGIAEIGLSFVEHRFLRLTHVNRFERAEDFNLGQELSAAAGVSTPALGGETETVLFLAGRGRRGVALGAGRFLLGQAEWAGRHRGGRWENAVGEAALDGFARLASRAVLLTRVQYRHGENLDPETQITLGAQNGLRGYAVHQWVGTRSLLLASESRLFVADDVRQLASFGVAAFAEAGYAWPAGRGVTLRDLRADVGISLLVGRNRLTTSQRATRIDLAYAFNPAPGRGRWLLSFGIQPGFLN